MKRITIVLGLIMSSTILVAQCPIKKGQAQLNAGVGLSSWGVPVYVGLDYGVHKDITLGGELSFRRYDAKWAGTNYTHTVTGISGNGNYHFNHLLSIPTNWDLYCGLNVGFYIWNSPNTYNGSNSSGLGLGAQLGGRYYFNNKVGLNLECGGGNAMSGGKLGLSIKF